VTKPTPPKKPDLKIQQAKRANDDACGHDHSKTPATAPVHVDMKDLLIRLAQDENGPFTSEEVKKMAGAHQPDMLLIACIDSRIQPARALEVGPGVALEYRPIGCVIPPEAQAGDDLDSRMAFRRMNNIKNIVLICHSDCGGAKAAINVPEPDKAKGDDLHIVASQVHRTGLDIPKLSRDFLAAEHGDVNRAGDRLAKEVGIKSLENLLQYKGDAGFKTIADEMAKGGLTVTLLYYDLAQQNFEVYSPKNKSWKPLAAAPKADVVVPDKKRVNAPPKPPKA